MDAKITARTGITPEQLAEVEYWTPIKAPDLWLSRADAGEALGVGPRTIDRYTRAHRLTTYAGPIGGNLRGVRVLKSEVDNWSTLNVRVVAEDG